jgi:hypothetical protein
LRERSYFLQQTADAIEECAVALRRGEVDAISAVNAQLAGVGSAKDFRLAGIEVTGGGPTTTLSTLPETDP